MIAGIPYLKYHLNFFLNRILVVKVVSIYLKSSTLSSNSYNLYTVTSSCIVISRHDQVLSVTIIYF